MKRYNSETIIGHELESVKEDGLNIQYIDTPSEELQLLAVKQNGLLIQFIKNPSTKVQLEAIKEEGYAIQYIKNPTEELKTILTKTLLEAL